MPETIETAMPPALPGEVVMSRDEAARSRRPGLREAKCYIYCTHAKMFWKPENIGYTMERAEAGKYEVSYVISLPAHDYVCYIIAGQLESEKPPKPGEPVRKSNVMLMVDPQLIAMLKAAPLNETFRARLMAKLGEMPPKEVDTWDKIVDWVEFNFPKTVPVIPGSPATPRPGITIDVSARETESGTCRYTRTLQGSSYIELSAARLIELAENSDGDWEEFLDSVYEVVRERAYEDISMEDVEGTEETERHESNGDGEGMELDYSVRTLKDRLEVFMRANLSREQLDNFDL